MKRSQRPSALTFTSITTITGIALLGFASSVFAHDHGDHGGIQTRLKGYAEVPSVSSTAKGRFKASINGDTINYELSYRDLEGEVRQAHIHFGQRGVNGGVAVYLCQTSFNPDPTGLAPTCPQSGTVSGTLRAANVVGPAGQGIDATDSPNWWRPYAPAWPTRTSTRPSFRAARCAGNCKATTTIEHG